MYKRGDSESRASKRKRIPKSVTILNINSIILNIKYNVESPQNLSHFVIYISSKMANAIENCLYAFVSARVQRSTASFSFEHYTRSA